MIETEKPLYLHGKSNSAYPGDNSYDVKYYKLELKIYHESQSIRGIVSVTAESNITSLLSFYLDLSNQLVVDSVKSGSTRLAFTHVNSKLNITLPAAIGLRETFSVQVFYGGFPEIPGSRSFVFETHNGQPSIWSLSEPYGSKDWWPNKDNPSDKADSSDVWINCSPELTAVSNGVLTDVIFDPDGTKKYMWKNSYPISPYLISVAVSNYSLYEDAFEYNGFTMPIVHYIYPEHLDAVKPELDKTVFMLKIFSDAFGLYPFIKEKYGHAEFSQGGMEHQTITSLGIFQESVIAHELGHQWFGDKITCRDWENIWINEGFATYTEGVYTEKTYGKEAYKSFVTYHMQRSLNVTGSIYVQDISNVAEIFSARSYSKGAMVLHMLRGITGDSIFYRILREYANDSLIIYNSAVTEDLQRVAESVSGLDLDYFFQEWIYGENYPKYNINWDYKHEENNFYRVNIKITQAVNINPLYFTMPLQFKISTSVKDTIITLFNDQQGQSFTFLIIGEPKDFVFDPENLILKDSYIEDPPGFKIPGNSVLMQNYPNPFNSSTEFAFGIPKRAFVNVSIFNILGENVETIVNEELDAGYYHHTFNGLSLHLASGPYILNMKTNNANISRKIIFLK